MVWTMMLIAIAVLFAIGFLWPGMWFAAIVLFIVWLLAMVVWGLRRRDGGASTVEGERPRHRIE